MSAESRWQAALSEHQAALAAYAGAVRALGDDAWTRPWSQGKWTPAQITEHLTLGYRAFLREARGEGGMKMKVFGVRRRLLRWFLLPHILFHRAFPLKAVSPREIRPAEGSPDREAALAELLATAAEAEHAIQAARGRPGAVLTHPYFGGIELGRGLRFAAVHVEHHTRQVRATLAAASSSEAPAPDSGAPAGR
jgi:hypothetical protein